MKLLIKIEDALSNQKYMYLGITDSGTRSRIKSLQEKGNLCGLKSLALSKGRVLGILHEHDIHDVEAELIISHSNSHIDLT